MTAPDKTKTRRYQLVLPEVLYDEIHQKAEEQGTTVVDLIRRFIKLGLIAMELQDQPDSGVIIRQGADEHKVLLF